MSAVALASPSLPRFSRRTPCDRAKAQETERQLLIRYHSEGDLAAREELAERFLPLARDLALRYTYTDEPFDDLLQVASLGLVKAIDRFDPTRGTKFTSYAAPTILGELKRHFRDKGWALHVPRDLQERTLAVSRATEALSKRFGRSPRVREVAAELLRERLGRTVHRERALLEIARHVQGPALVAEVPLQLAENGRRGVARELRAPSGLEAVDRLDQAEARDLEQVVERLVRVGVAQREVTGEWQEALAELLARGEVPQLVVADQQPAFGLPRIGARAGRASCGPCESGCRNSCSGHTLDLSSFLTFRSVSQPSNNDRAASL